MTDTITKSLDTITSFTGGKMDTTNRDRKCLTMKVDECAALLEIGKATMYDIVNNALANNGQPFAVIKIKGKLLVSRKSFNSYLESINL